MFPVLDAAATQFPGGADVQRFPAPDAAIVRFPPLLTPLVNAAASGSGTFAVQLHIIVAITAPATGSGTADNVFIRTVIDAPAFGAGVANLAVVPVAAITVPGAAGGTAGITGLPVAVVIANAAAAGTGFAGVVVGAVIQAAATGSGTASNPIAVAAVTTCAASGSGAASNVVTTFKPSGMNKNGTHAVQNTYTEVQNWTADTGGYPGSTVSSHALVANGTKTGATVASTCLVSNSQPAAINCTLRLYRNGVLLVTGTATSVPAFSSANVTVSTTADIAGGDLITLQALAPSTLEIQTGTGSYVRIT